MIERQIILLNDSESPDLEVIGTLAPLKKEFADLQTRSGALKNVAKMLTSETSLIIMDGSHWAMNHAGALFEIRRLQYRGALLLLVDDPITEAKLADVMPVRSSDLLLLERPFSWLELQTVVCRVLRGQACRHRVDRRFPVEVPVTIEVDAWDRPSQSFSSRILELSRSGAYVSGFQTSVGNTSNTQDLRMGERCRLTFELADKRQNYCVDSRIVRVDAKGFGVRFATAGHSAGSAPHSSQKRTAA